MSGMRQTKQSCAPGPFVGSSGGSSIVLPANAEVLGTDEAATPVAKIVTVSVTAPSAPPAPDDLVWYVVAP